LAQDRADRSKKTKVIFRQIDSVRGNPADAGLGRLKLIGESYEDDSQYSHRVGSRIFRIAFSATANRIRHHVWTLTAN
jgi:hypothetical protein